jgi:cell division protein FtsA
MSKSAPLITAIDIGTTKVCTVVGSGYTPSHMNIVAHSTVPSRGIRKGSVSDASEVTQAVRASVSKVEAQLGRKIHSAYISVTGGHISFENRRQRMSVRNDLGVVTQKDLARMPIIAAKNAVDNDRELIHAIALEYAVGKNEGIRNPIGMHTKEIEVDSLLITGATSYVEKLVRSVEAAGVAVEDMVLDPIASSRAVLQSGELQRGVAVVDIGGGTTDLVAFRENRVVYTTVIPVGGYQFTSDIAFVYQAAFNSAEQVKINHVNISPKALNDEGEIPITTSAGKELMISKGDVCKLARERAQELVKLVALKLMEAETGPIASTRVVLTGGASQLEGLEEAFQHGLTKHARIGAPEGMRSLPETLKGPEYSTAVGTLMWAGAKLSRPPGVNGVSSPPHNSSGLISGVVGQIRRLLPTA